MEIANLPRASAAIKFGSQGTQFRPVSALRHGGHALGEAAETIIRGDADVMLAGGSEAPVFEVLVGAFRRDACPLHAQRRP